MRLLAKARARVANDGIPSIWWIMKLAHQTKRPDSGSGGAPRRRAATRGPVAPSPDAVSPPRHNAIAPHAVEVLESYFGADGRPIKRKSLGAARVARSYDERGNQVEEAYYNTDGKPTARKGLGAARIHWRYDESGKKVEAEFFGADGALLSREDSSRRELELAPV